MKGDLKNYFLASAGADKDGNTTPTVLENPCCKGEDVYAVEHGTVTLEFQSNGQFDIVASEGGDIDWDQMYCQGCDSLLKTEKQEDGTYALIKRVFIKVKNN